VNKRALKILQEVCSLPTAPFVESAVVAYIERFVQQRKRLKLSRDTHGNLLIELPGKTRSPRWVFTAHMDHPGFVATKMLDARTLEARFHGWVLIDLVRGTNVRFFSGGTEITGKVIDATSDDYDRAQVPKVARVRVASSVQPGSPGMFDQGEARIIKGKIHCRALDDLAGLAAALAMMDDLSTKPASSTIALLCTRAEEEGFIGALAAVLHPKLLRKTDRLIAIECSAMQPYAPQGAGAILRVGDKTSIFNSDITYFLTQQAEALQKVDKTFKFQRALMPGGTCEATVYDAWGHLAGSICVPLGNYHNMNKEKKRIEAEYIDLTDWTNMVKLFVQVARNAHTHAPGLKALKDRVTKRFNSLKHFL
jgi:endoglucanase